MPHDDLKFEEVEVLEAEVIEESIERIGYTPAVIDAKTYLEARRQRLDKMLEPYQGMDGDAILAMNVSEAKTCRADLNRIIKEVDDERKAIKKAYNAPLAAFEAEVNNLLQPAKGAQLKLKQYIEQHEEEERKRRRCELEQAYVEYAPALVPVVPFDRILDINPKWLNKCYGAMKAADELLAAVDRVAKDWEVLKRSKDTMASYEQAEVVFFNTLDLNAAFEWDTRFKEEAERIRQLNEEVESNRQAQEMPVIEQVVDPEPLVGMDVREPYVIRISLSEFEKNRLVGFIKAENIGSDRFIGKAKE